MPTDQNNHERENGESYSWPQYRLYVVSELRRITRVMEVMEARITDNETFRAEQRGAEAARKRMAALVGGLAAVLVEVIKAIVQSLGRHSDIVQAMTRHHR